MECRREAGILTQSLIMFWCLTLITRGVHFLSLASQNESNQNQFSFIMTVSGGGRPWKGDCYQNKDGVHALTTDLNVFYQWGFIQGYDGVRPIPPVSFDYRRIPEETFYTLSNWDRGSQTPETWKAWQSETLNRIMLQFCYDIDFTQLSCVCVRLCLYADTTWHGL